MLQTYESMTDVGSPCWGHHSWLASVLLQAVWEDLHGYKRKGSREGDIFGSGPWGDWNLILRLGRYGMWCPRKLAGRLFRTGKTRFGNLCLGRLKGVGLRIVGYEEEMCGGGARGSKALRLRGLDPTRLHPSVRGEEWRFSWTSHFLEDARPS